MPIVALKPSAGRAVLPQPTGCCCPLAESHHIATSQGRVLPLVPSRAAMAWTFGRVDASQLGAIQAMEAASYPADEAASPENLAFRAREASDYFLVMTTSEGGHVRGYVCGTLSSEDALTHESMASHVSGGWHLCVHSVCVDPEWTRRGLGKTLLSAYMDHLRALPGAVRPRKVSLLCKPHLESFYAAAGFKSNGPSPVVHGADVWTDMSLDLAQG